MSLPSGPIQTLAPGLLSVLQLKNTGRLPSVLLGDVSPSIDMLDFYLRSLGVANANAAHTRTQVTASGNFYQFNAGGKGSIVVPQTEWWWVEHYSVTAVMSAVAGQAVEGLTPALAFNTSSSLEYAGVGRECRSAISNATAANAILVSSDKPFWAPPGSILGYFVGSVISAAGISLQGRYRATKLLA